MIDPSPTPSRLLRLFALVARWSLGLVLAFWILLAAAWGTLHGFIVPRIADWRSQVERLATQALGTPVHIAAIAAQSNGLFPTVHLTGVSVLDAQGREALKLNNVVATVSARSVLRGRLEQLYIEAPALDIRHLADGRWQIAGIDVVQSDSTESTALEWLLDVPELVIRQGRVLFTDEARALAPVQLRDVDVVLRNRHWSHVLRMDAVPDTGRDEHIQLVGAFRRSLLATSHAAWKNWSGQWYANLALQQVPALPWPQAWGIRALNGGGKLRAWVDIQNGRPIGMTADVALADAQVDWQDAHLQALRMQQLRGRLEGSWQPHGWRLEAQDLSFRTADGHLWPQSRWAVRATGALDAPESAHIDLDYADLAVASGLVQSLPLPGALRDAATRWTPRGTLRQLQVQWLATGPYQARGQIADLSLRPQPAGHDIGTPGIDGLDAVFELNSKEGKAALGMRQGALHFPGVFEDPSIPIHQLQAQVHWTLQDGAIRVDVPQARFENSDAAGTLQGFWRTGDTPDDRLPGYLQLKGQLERANGARVHRYLPLEIPAVARHYVRDSIRQGTGQHVEFEVRGMLRDMPFDRPGTGRFYIKAPVSHVVYDFVPAALREPGTPPWPALTDLNGTLVFEGASMQVQQADTGFAGHPQLRMGFISAQIPDLNQPTVSIHAVGQTGLDAALQLVRQSPLAELTDHALDAAKAQGDAHIAFDLELPIEHLHHSKVRGRIGFQHNSLQLNPEAPSLQGLQGSVQFHERGFSLQDVQGKSLGGDFRIQGGMSAPQQGMRLRVEGMATADGLRQDSAVPLPPPIAARIRGQSPYTVDITARGTQQHIVVRSSLQGMALDLPAPLQKSAEDPLELSVQQSLQAHQLQALQIDLGTRGQVRYALEQGRVQRGHLVLGHEPGPLPPQGVVADVRQPALDLDAWLQLLRSSQTDATDAAVQMWLPQRIRLDVDRLTLQERELEDVQADLTRTAQAWQGKLQGKHFAGTVEYRPASAQHEGGHLSARLSHLTIPRSEAQHLDTLPQSMAQDQVETLPALDIEVEQLQVADRQLGRLQLKARNQAGRFGREWTLEQFDLTVPEARWRAQGLWGSTARDKPSTTQLQFTLDIHSSGKLLERFGMPGIVRDGQGHLRGQITWQGSPITPDWHSMDGDVQMQIDKGQFLKVQPGMGKLLSVLSLQSLTRRISLDFRDVFSQGFAFDFIRGDVQIAQGVAHTQNLEMTGLNAAVLMEGSAHLIDETQHLRVVIVPEINAMTASLAATAINPVVGVGSFLAQMFLRGPLMEAATRTFEITGSWADPVVQKVPNKAPPQVQPVQE